MAGAVDAVDLDRDPMARLEEAAALVMDPDAWGYYATGARDERTLAQNVAAWDGWWWRPRRLTGGWDASIATTVLGRPSPHPIIVGPSAAHRLAHPEGELATARAVAALGGTIVLSTSSNRSVEEVAGVVGLEVWFQLYPFEDARFTERLVRRVVDAGVRAIVLTVDVTSDADPSARPVGGFQGRDIGYAHHSGHEPVLRQMTWAWADRLRASCGVPVVLKGILHPDDADRAAREGYAGIVVSNHGGRKLEGAMPSAVALPACFAAVAGRLEVFVDGGIRRGGHALVALALGARGVMIGRPVLWGLALGGEAGVRTVLSRLIRELAEDAAHADILDVRDIDPDILVRALG
jgi:4-hydroxymandelate oxidase